MALDLTVQLLRVSPKRFLFLDPFLSPDPFPAPQVLQGRQMRSPHRVMHELVEPCARQLRAIRAALESAAAGALAYLAATGLFIAGAFAAVAPAAVAILVDQQGFAAAAVQSAGRGKEFIVIHV